MTEPLLFLLVFLALLALDLAAVAARAALQESSYARLLSLREEFGEQVNRAIHHYHIYPRVLAGLNLVLALAHFFLAGWVLFVLFGRNPAVVWWQVFLALFLSTLLLFFAEQAVVSRVMRDPERSAVRLGKLTAVLAALPLAFSKSGSLPDEAGGSVTEDELKTLVDAGEEEGVIEKGERRMIYSVIALGDTLAREIMVPRIDMLTLEVNTPLPEAVDVLLASGHSRVPVYEDTVDNMLGLLYAKDLLRLWRESQQLDSLRSLLRPAYYIPEAKKVDELLAEMQKRRIHLAMVVDEYGGIAGMVTLEDIVEEILGEIQDEYDQAEESPYQVMKNGDIIFLGRIDLDDFNEIMNSQLSKDEADTLGGYIYGQLGHVPVVGEMVVIGSLHLMVEQVSAHRIRKVRARWMQPEEQRDEESSHVDR